MAQPATPSRPGPAVAVLMVIADPEPLWLRRSLQSVLGQSHRHWRLSLAMCGTPSDVVASVLSEELSGVDAARVSRVTTAPDTPYADALALAFDGADAPFVLVVGQHDELAPDAVALLGEAVADAPLAYGDEDQIDGVETAWQPAPGHTQILIWPGAAPDAQPVEEPENDTKTVTDSLVAGRPWVEVGKVSRPTITVYPPKEKNTGAAVVVFPGGGYWILAIDLEGTEVCDWLTSKGITCVLLKYRVPGEDLFAVASASMQSRCVSLARAALRLLATPCTNSSGLRRHWRVMIAR